MPRSKEIQKQMRNKIVNKYQSGKGYKAISTVLGVQRTTIRAIIHKWRKLVTVVVNLAYTKVAGLPKLLQERNGNSSRRS